MRLLLVIAGLLLVASCQRDYPEGHPATTAKATNAWDLLHYKLPQRTEPQPEEQQPEQINSEVSLGPQFSQKDTVDESLLPGAWMQICLSKGERISPIPPDEADVVELGSSGQLVWHFVEKGKDNPQSGTWEKTAPGTVTMSLGGQAGVVFKLEMFGENFFFFWNYDSSIGMWFARMPANAAPRIAYNHFTSNLGDFEFTTVNSNVFQGTATGDYQRNIGGFYARGVLFMRWEEPDTSAQGYAAFIVSPDWKELHGVWWIDDFQAAPFGGPYDAEADLGSKVAPAQTP